MAINKKTMRVDEDVEKLEPSSTAGRNIKYRNNLPLPGKVKHKVII